MNGGIVRFGSRYLNNTVMVIEKCCISKANLQAHVYFGGLVFDFGAWHGEFRVSTLRWQTTKRRFSSEARGLFNTYDIRLFVPAAPVLSS